MITGKTTLVAHLGYPTAGFKAPMIYNPWFERRGIDAVVVPMGFKPEDYAAGLNGLRRLTNLRGALVTMPHKVATLALMDEVTPTSGVGGQAEPPAEVYVVDALLHDDVWPDAKPELRIYDTVVRGITHPDNPMRQGDRLDMLESVQFLGRGPHALRMAEFARYPELVATVCEQAGWDASRLRVFRCRVRYPIYGSQIGLAFPLTD